MDMESGVKSEIGDGRPCRNCAGDGWVCENHQDTPWDGGDGCCGGAGAPCPVCNPALSNTTLINGAKALLRMFDDDDGRPTPVERAWVAGLRITLGAFDAEAERAGK